MIELTPTQVLADILKTVLSLAQDTQLAQIGERIGKLINLDTLVPKIKLVSFYLTVLFSFIFMVILMKLRRIILAMQASQTSSQAPDTAKSGSGPYRARWDEISRHMDSAKEAEWKFAVIEADKLADLILKRAGFPGDSMGERLMSIKDGQVLALQDLWDAHKVRNQLAHDVNYFLRYSEARQAIEKYEKFLQEMGVL